VANERNTSGPEKTAPLNAKGSVPEHVRKRGETDNSDSREKLHLK